MAGHSQFKNVMHRKGAQDARRAQQFTRLIREITLAARGGLPIAASNPRLRAALAAAREANLPKDTLERAIRKAAGPDSGKEIAEVRYEGYGPAGVAIIIETATDNRNRTASDLRAIFTRHGGALAETNAVTFLFERLGVLTYPSRVDADALLEAAIEASVEDLRTDSEGHAITTAIDSFFAVRDALEAKFGPPEKAGLEWRPQRYVALDAEREPAVSRLLEAFNENEDVQEVFSNALLPESVEQAAAPQG
ncbi:MAG: YebC/PmpR family DNA-binding transcriptional regulator [Acetobacteraceae bacterium]